MHIFLTGAAGFIGSRLARVLLDRGDSVVGLDNFNDYYDVRLKKLHLADLLPDKRFTFVQGDLADAELLAKLFADRPPEAVAHLAAMAAVRYSVEHPLIYGAVNVQGSMNLMDAARRIAPARPRMVIASTGSVYGSSTPVPFKEDAPADRPLAPYPASKRAMELMAHGYFHLWKLPTTILRFFNVYGPHGRPDMMPWQWSRSIAAGQPITLYNAGRLKRDWTFVDDVVDGFIAAIDRPADDYQIINLGAGRPVENLRFVEILEKTLGKKAVVIDQPVPPSEPLVTYADTTQARSLLGYDPKVTVEQGIPRFVDWLRSTDLPI
ncbi:MAG: GDP-mannose 4,6-dehydratase [Phycisphaeraceae bacterium]|nr:GDP-mannose 4,6-dehydratase [Phycisphaeraceae bacterium]